MTRGHQASKTLVRFLIPILKTVWKQAALIRFKNGNQCDCLDLISIAELIRYRMTMFNGRLTLFPKESQKQPKKLLNRLWFASVHQPPMVTCSARNSWIRPILEEALAFVLSVYISGAHSTVAPGDFSEQDRFGWDGSQQYAAPRQFF